MAKTEPTALISSSIKDFKKKPMREAALGFFHALGYRSERALELKPNNAKQFRIQFDPNASLNEGSALLDEWLSVDLLFQLTDAEIQEALKEQGQLFSAKKIHDTDIRSYLLFSVDLKERQYSRAQLAGATREINKLFPMPVMMIYKHGDALSLAVIARRLNKRDETRDVLQKVTLIKDISVASPHRAHLEILADLSVEELQEKHELNNFADLQIAWEKVLDTNELNKKFYKEIANWYFWAVKTVKFPEDAEKDQATRNATGVIRLITRLIFVWFIKEKGLVHEDLFDERRLNEILNSIDPKESTYYKAILQNLFFATLNTEMGAGREFRRENAKGQDPDYLMSNFYRYKRYFKNSDNALKLFAGIPFLNGGLFECLDKEIEKGNVVRVDGFSDRDDNPLQVPNSLFFGTEHPIDLNEIYDTKNKKYKVRGLIHILNSYKFTIEENTPIEEEIALDPELLGKVFENLLAAYNPETGTTARKQTGSFYTPREIVNYMVDEALIAYLESALNEDEGQRTKDKDRLRQLLAYTTDLPQFNEAEKTQLIAAIDTVKVLDPAAGSGAFPMGVLHKLVLLLGKLDPNNERWKQRQLDKAYEMSSTQAREAAIQSTEEVFADNHDDYGRKLYLIENCIYGVDIQPIAVQIAKLRFFISLVVDQKTNAQKENLGIRPLPNLETKFVAANTLIGLQRPELGKVAALSFGDMLYRGKQDELKEVRKNHFSARSPATKRKYRNLDKQLRAEISELLKKDGWGSESAQQLAGWDPYNQNAHADFFDSEWMFGIEGGFDVVIGNPPYLESRHPAFSDDLKISYQKAAKLRWGDDAALITRGSDLLIYFFENGIFNINKDGCVALLTQNSWLDTEYGKKFQAFLLKHTYVQKVVDSDFRYFASGEGPNINAVVTLFRGKKPDSKNIIAFVRYHENFQNMAFKNLGLAGDEEKTSVEVHRYTYQDALLRDLKWGILLTSSDEVLSLLKTLKAKAIRLDDFNGAQLSFGQGLNLTKSFVINSDILSQFGFAKQATIPFVTSDDGASFVVNSTEQFILDKTKLSSKEIRELKQQGIDVFDPDSTSKSTPKLMLPRGISKHFCALNNVHAYSSSFVDLYDNNNSASQETIFNLWLFFNSSVCWLIREISGRKNLGGGMLKAEAVDLESFAVYMDFKKLQEIKSIMKSLEKREAFQTVVEIDSDEHKRIDTIVFDYLGLSSNERSQIVETLKMKVQDREKKSKT